MKKKFGKAIIIGLGVLWMGGCAGGQKREQTALMYVNQGGIYQLNPEEFIAGHPLGEEENIRIDFLGQDVDTSYHFAQIRDREPLHRHEKSDLSVTLLRGHGVLRLGAKEIKIRQGDTINVPGHSNHAFINRSAKPAAAFVMFRPPLTKGDRILVNEK